MLFILLIGFLICLFLQVRSNRCRIEKNLKGFVTPPGLPLVKHLNLFVSDSELENNILNIAKKYGSLLKLELFYGIQFLLVTNKDFINHILATKPILTKDVFYDFTRPFIGDGLITCAPEKWKKSRRMLNPAFNVQLLDKYVGTFGGTCDVLVDRLKKEVGNGGFDIFSHTYLCGLDIICESAMGIKMNAQTMENSQYVEDIHTMTQIVVNRLFSPFKRFRPTHMLTSDYWRERKVVARIRNFTKKVIEDKQRLRMHNTTKNAVSDDINKNKDTLSLLDILLDAKQNGIPMTDEYLIDETQSFLFAGHETAATTTALCLYCLSKYPEVQDKVFEELHLIFDGNKRYPTWADLNKMRYLEMVIKETLRLYTPVPLISRLIDEDLEYGNVFVPKGLSVLIYLQGLHMNPEYFSDPEKFDPSRFESEIPFAFMPFSAGPRNCIGQRFAMLEMKYIICQVLREFVVLPVPGHVPQRLIQVLLRFKNGAMIRLKSREILL